jgi:hypothetical protein
MVQDLTVHATSARRTARTSQAQVATVQEQMMAKVAPDAFVAGAAVRITTPLLTIPQPRQSAPACQAHLWQWQP